MNIMTQNSIYLLMVAANDLVPFSWHNTVPNANLETSTCETSEYMP